MDPVELKIELKTSKAEIRLLRKLVTDLILALGYREEDRLEERERAKKILASLP